MPWFETPIALLPDLIAQNGRWLAERPALIDGAARMSWREFAACDRATRERPCVPRGSAPRERVAVLMDTRIETVIAMFGIVRAGAVAVPLNVSINDAAIATMCADAGCVAVFASGASLRAHRCVARLRRDSARVISSPANRRAQGWRDFHAFIAAAERSAPDGADCAGR